MLAVYTIFLTTVFGWLIGWLSVRLIVWLFGCLFVCCLLTCLFSALNFVFLSLCHLVIAMHYGLSIFPVVRYDPVFDTDFDMIGAFFSLVVLSFISLSSPFPFRLT